jgi:hypothetical protein
MRRRIKKLARPARRSASSSASLSRAEITFFDEPYLGLDAVARQIFYDRLLEDYAEHPRTIILSSHLIDEVANLLERVIVVDGGRIVMDEETDAVRGRAAVLTGDARSRRRSRSAARSSIENLGTAAARCPRTSPQTTARRSHGRARDRPGLSAAADRPHHPARVRGRPRRRSTPMNRRDRHPHAVRNKYTFVWLPLIILGASFLMSLGIFAIIPYDGVKTAAAARRRSGTSSRSASCRSVTHFRSRRR